MSKSKATNRKSGAAVRSSELVLLRALRARKGYARKRQNHKLCNQNGWCFWAGQLLLIEKLEASLAQQNDQAQRRQPETPSRAQKGESNVQ